MIPEVGQFALIVALLARAHDRRAAARRRGSWRSTAGCEARWPLARAQCGFVAIAFGCLAVSFMGNDFSVGVRRGQFEFDAAARLSLRRGLGRPRRFDAALDLAAHVVDGGGIRIQQAVAARMVARVLGVMSWIAAGFLLFMLFTSNPFSAAVAARDGWPRSQPAAAGPGHGLHIRRSCTWAMSASRWRSRLRSRRCCRANSKPRGRAGRARGRLPRGPS